MDEFFRLFKYYKQFRFIKSSFVKTFQNKQYYLNFKPIKSTFIKPFQNKKYFLNFKAIFDSEFEKYAFYFNVSLWQFFIFETVFLKM